MDLLTAAGLAGLVLFLLRNPRLIGRFLPDVRRGWEDGVAKLHEDRANRTGSRASPRPELDHLRVVDGEGTPHAAPPESA